MTRIAYWNETNNISKTKAKAVRRARNLLFGSVGIGFVFEKDPREKNIERRDSDKRICIDAKEIVSIIYLVSRAAQSERWFNFANVDLHTNVLQKFHESGLCVLLLLGSPGTRFPEYFQQAT